MSEIYPYLEMELGLPRGKDTELKYATVKKRIVDIKEKTAGKANKKSYS